MAPFPTASETPPGHRTLAAGILLAALAVQAVHIALVAAD
jgi:hypothetical protein